MNTVGISRTRLHGPWLLIGRVTCAALIILSLGLFVASQIMGLHNGTIKVESKVGEGTTFVLRFKKEQ